MERSGTLGMAAAIGLAPEAGRRKLADIPHSSIAAVTIRHSNDKRRCCRNVETIESSATLFEGCEVWAELTQGSATLHPGLYSGAPFGR